MVAIRFSAQRWDNELEQGVNVVSFENMLTIHFQDIRISVIFDGGRADWLPRRVTVKYWLRGMKYSNQNPNKLA